MRTRSTLFFPPSTGATQTFPKRNESWRLVSCYANGFPGVQNKQLLLIIQDGGNNNIAVFPTPMLSAGTALNVTFTTAPVDASLSTSGLAVGAFLEVCIPDDLWLQPQWTATLQWSPNDATDTLSLVNLQTETFTGAAKKVDPRRIVPQDSDTE